MEVLGGILYDIANGLMKSFQNKKSLLKKKAF
jgi:hypothetical protein